MFKKAVEKTVSKIIGKDIGVQVIVPGDPDKMMAINTLAQMGLTLANAIRFSTQVTIRDCNFSDCDLGASIATDEGIGRRDS
jgi:uridine phosphorylase